MSGNRAGPLAKR